MALEIGSVLNKRYRIIEVLGQGGMAAVYRAIDENLGVEVCVKENLFTTDEYARQFRLEATILASLRQSNLPRVSDHFVIEPQGQYLVMDYIEGEDLRQRLDRLGQLPEEEVIIIGVAICDALAYMHSRQPMILHRDIKPGNVRITPNGHIYLVDFGLVKLVEGRETTNTGARAMTPGYSPPEQYGTARTDPRSDIYSLGATLYSALTNVLPEDALDQAMGRIELTPINKHNSRVSIQVANIIEKCLAVRAEDRYQSADDLRYALMEARSVSKRKLPLELVLQPPPMRLHERLPDGGNVPRKDAEIDGVPAGVNNKRNTKPLNQITNDVELKPYKSKTKISTTSWLLLAILPLLILTGYSIYVARPDVVIKSIGYIFPDVIPSYTPTSLPDTATTYPVLVLQTKTISPTISPTSTETIIPSPTTTATHTPSPTITLTPLPTPMGGASQLAFASSRSGAVEVWLMNVDGTGFKQITDIPEGACQPKWSPDGMRLVFISPCTRDLNSYPGASLFMINADGSNMTPLPNAPGGDFDPSWSPDGKQLAFTSLRNNGVSGIYILNVTDNSVKALVQDESRAISQPAWSPDGKLIAYVNSDNRIWVTDVNGENKRSLIIGEWDYLINSPAWSPDGSVVIFTRSVLYDPSRSTILMAVQYTDKGAIPVEIPNSSLVMDTSYSFDGYWLLFTSWFTGNHELYIMRSSGVDRQMILNDKAYDFDPAWRPYVVTQP